MGHVFSGAKEERSLLGTRHLMIGSTGNSEFSFRDNVILIGTLSNDDGDAKDDA